MSTVLSGTSGALYYTPAGTSVTTLTASAFPSSASNITVGSYLGFRVDDPVTLAYPGGATTTDAIPAGAYFVKTYVASTGIMTLSSTAGGSAVTATAQPSGFGSSFASITYTAPVVVGSVRDWSFEITRSEIDVTTIGQEVGQYTPFRTYIAGFADGTGSATVYNTDDDSNMANRLIEDVIQRQQTGARMKLYIDRVVVSGTVNDTSSRFINVPVILTSASLTVNPDDGQSVAINFRPSEAPTFDLSKSS
jgi:hypothetical protein